MSLPVSIPTIIALLEAGKTFYEKALSYSRGELSAQDVRDHMAASLKLLDDVNARVDATIAEYERGIAAARAPRADGDDRPGGEESTPPLSKIGI